MHLGILTSDLSFHDGWAHHSHSLVHALHQQGIQLTILTAHNATTSDFPIHPILPSVTPAQSHNFLKQVALLPQARRLLADCDVIHANVEIYAPLAHWIADGRPLFITAHGSYVYLPQIRPFPVNRIYRRAFEASQLICVSSYTASVAQKLMPSVQTHVINNGLDVSRFEHLPDLTKAKQGPIVLTNGGIKPRKGTLELVEAMAEVRQHILDVQCIILGTYRAQQAYTRQVMDAIERLHLSDTVRLCGFVLEEEMLGWLGAADVFVLPSVNAGWRFEGFGLVVLEASAAGLPVIGTDNCGVADAIDHNITGLVISQAKVAQELAPAIIDILTHPDKAQKMGQAGRLKTQNQTWEAVAQQIISLYKKALN